MVSAVGFLMLVGAVLGIVFRSGCARSYQRFNQAVLGIRQSLQLLKTIYVLLSIVAGLIGAWLIIGNQTIGSWEQQRSFSDRVALAVFVVVGSAIQEVILLVVRRRWTQVAIENGDRLFGFAMAERCYRRVNIGASVILVALVIWGSVELLRLLL